MSNPGPTIQDSELTRKGLAYDAHDRHTKEHVLHRRRGPVARRFVDHNDRHALLQIVEASQRCEELAHPVA